MRNFKLISALVILLALPGLAMAGTLENVTGVADCNSWSADLTISFQAHTMMSRVEYTVVVQDATGAEVDRFDFADFIDMADTPTAIYDFGGDWHVLLDGNYTVTADFTVYDIFGDAYNLSYGSFTADLACGDTRGSTEPVCQHTARYWRRHADLWPVTSLEIGGQTYDQTALMQMLGRTRHHHPHFRRHRGLIRQLVAAQLNLAAGSPADIQSVVDEANDLLANPPTGRRAWGHQRRQTQQLRRALRQYNRSGCEGADDKGISMELGDTFDKSADKAAEETMSFGSLKAMYQ